MRRYYNPAITPEQADALDWENMVLLQAIQATLDNISPDVRAVFVAASAGSATLHYIVAEGTQEACVEDIDDTLAEFDAAMAGTPGYEAVQAEVHVEEIPRDWVELGWRGLYWSKGWKAWTSDDQPHT